MINDLEHVFAKGRGYMKYLRSMSTKWSCKNIFLKVWKPYAIIREVFLKITFITFVAVRYLVLFRFIWKRLEICLAPSLLIIKIDNLWWEVIQQFEFKYSSKTSKRSSTF